MPSRRQFLQQSALVSLTPLIPTFLTRSLAAADLKPDDRMLVVIQLDGGNDGLNTVIPYTDELYARYRKELRIGADTLLKLDDSVGLHPNLKSVSKLFEEGRLAVVQGVGYPNPNRSHFESMAIWHHARLTTAAHDQIGWLGRTADRLERPNPSRPDSIYVGAEAIPVALRGRRANALSLENEGDLKLAAEVAATTGVKARTENLAAYVQQTLDQSFQAARRISESIEGTGTDGDGYPASKLARKLRLIAKLIKLGAGTRIFYVSQGGYDTHSAQASQHGQLLSEFSGSLKAFLDDLDAAKLADRVVVMAFSEFGRRVQENGSAGTDHGVAGPVLLAGNPVKGGVIGPHPSLTDLDEGDLMPSVDFRQIYATLLSEWLKVDANPVLGGAFASISFLKPNS